MDSSTVWDEIFLSCLPTPEEAEGERAYWHAVDAAADYADWVALQAESTADDEADQEPDLYDGFPCWEASLAAAPSAFALQPA